MLVICTVLNGAVAPQLTKPKSSGPAVTVTDVPAPVVVRSMGGGRSEQKTAPAPPVTATWPWYEFATPCAVGIFNVSVPGVLPVFAVPLESVDEKLAAGVPGSLVTVSEY